MEVPERIRSLIDREFRPPSRAEQVARAIARLNKDHMDDPERTAAAIIILLRRDPDGLDRFIDLAQTDWRDLYMAAGLGHEDWRDRIEALERGDEPGQAET